MTPKRRRLLLIVSAFLLMAGVTFRSALTQTDEWTDRVFNWLAIILAVLACVADSRALGRPVIRSFQWQILLFWPISLVFYLQWSRGPWGLVVFLILLACYAGLWLTIVVPIFVIRLLISLNASP